MGLWSLREAKKYTDKEVKAKMDSVDAQLAEIADKVVFGQYDVLSNVTWEIGSIGADSGYNSPMTTRIRTTTYLPIGNYLLRILDSTVKFNLFYYSKTDNSYVSTTGFIDADDYTITDTYLVKLVLAYDDNRSLTDTTLSSKAELLIPKIKNVNADVQLLKDYFKQTTDWEIGSIGSISGNNSGSTTRIRTVDYLPLGKYLITIKSNININVFRYNDKKQFITSTGFISTDYEVNDSSEYVRIVLRYPDNRTISDIQTLANEVEIINKSNIRFESVEENQKVLSVSSGDEWEWFGSVISESDITVVKDELWTFHPSNDEHTDYQIARRYNLDFEAKTVSLIDSFYHNFGHVNTVDYNQDNDTLIFGNGSGVYDTEGQIYLIKNPYAMVGNEQVDLADVSITIDCTGYGFGDKFNVMWGENNNEKYNICYLITNDQQDIRRLLLGMGTNDLGMGQFISGKAANEFNGTFKVLAHYQQITNGYPDVIQGGDYYNGIIYSGVGHDGIRYWQSRLLTDGTIERTDKIERIYGDDGNEIFTTMNGVAVYNGYLLVKSNSALRVIKL